MYTHNRQITIQVQELPVYGDISLVKIIKGEAPAEYCAVRQSEIERILNNETPDTMMIHAVFGLKNIIGTITENNFYSISLPWGEMFNLFEKGKITEENFCIFSPVNKSLTQLDGTPITSFKITTY